MVTELHQAKRPVSRLAGPYGHPFHPVLVTVPIGAWVASFVFDLASRWSAEPLVFTKGAWWLIGLGVVGALVAATFGFSTWSRSRWGRRRSAPVSSTWV